MLSDLELIEMVRRQLSNPNDIMLNKRNIQTVYGNIVGKKKQCENLQFKPCLKELVLEKIDDSHFNKSTEVSQPKQLMSTEFKTNVINESLPTKSYFKKEVKSLICGVKISVLDINATPK